MPRYGAHTAARSSAAFDDEVKMDGFINLLKPPGMTSSDAVVFVRRRLPRGTKVGHAGTLDPEAAGVLPVMVGRAARLSDHIMSGEKEYICEIALGAATDTQDAQGELVGERHEPADADAVRAVLSQFTGDIMQRPSAYSALKQGGKRLCDIARAGGEVNVQPRPVTIFELEYICQSAPDGHMLRVRCSKGTYIRALCDDIGRALGCGAHMRFLLRTLSAGFHLEDACTLEDLDADIAAHISHIDAPIMNMPMVLAGEELYARVRCGNRLPVDELRGDVGGDGVRRLYVRRPQGDARVGGDANTAAEASCECNVNDAAEANCECNANASAEASCECGANVAAEASCECNANTSAEARIVCGANAEIAAHCAAEAAAQEAAMQPVSTLGAPPIGYAFAGIVERDGDEMRFRAMLLDAEDGHAGI